MAEATGTRKREESDMRTLMLRARDEVDNLRDVLRAYVGLEKLLVPSSMDMAEPSCATRNELGALMTCVNEELCRRIEAVDIAVQSAGEMLEND